MAHRSDPALIESCLRGESPAWDTLVERYGRLVWSVARRYRLHDADAEDVFQSVFLILHRRLASLDDQTKLSAWLITTAHRECWRIGRRSGRTLGLDEQIADVGSPRDEDASRWETQHLVRLGLEKLGGRCEELLRALFLEPGEADYRMISERLGLPVGSIGPTRARCFRKLEEILRELGLDAPAQERAAAEDRSR